jgi:hypoxanthine phosphoribosyltransferase
MDDTSHTPRPAHAAASPVAGAELVASAQAVEATYGRLAAELQPVISAESCVLLGIMVGGIFPLVRLAALLEGDYEIDSCHATRYRGGLRGEELIWLARPRAEMAGRTVVVIDDIFDEGLTLGAVIEHCRRSGAGKVISAVLVSKRRDRRGVDWAPDHVGLHVDNRYVFGCGMDYRGRWRHLPALYALPEGFSD